MAHKNDDLEEEALLDDELFADLAKPDWSKKSLDELKLEESDRKLIQELSACIDACTDAKAAKDAWISFGLVAGEGLIKLARKAILGKE